MGLFSSRPEEPSEWAGLPSEPLPPRTEAELLRGEEAAPWQPDLLATRPADVTSIEIPVGDFLADGTGDPGSADGDGD
ncbi:hypothetical protein AB3M83_07915 [Microbacterium sp. 179-B 1A2 NHS]|uniref:hypothetical protein n=1 Tax=Microbacterium sp. 179-B 1A2 NHS TaxID=3142383 RepID=UPI0039A22C9D